MFELHSSRLVVVLLALTLALLSCGGATLANPRPAGVTQVDVPCQRARALRTQAATLVHEGRAERALRRLSAADAACPSKSSESWATRVTALASLRRDDEAQALASVIVKSPEASSEARKAAEAARSALGLPAGSGDAALHAAESAEKRGDDVEARRQFERAAVLLERELGATMKPEIVSAFETQLAKGSDGWSSDGSLYVMALGKTMVAYETRTWTERFAVSFKEQIVDLLVSRTVPVAIVTMDAGAGEGSVSVVDLRTGALRPFPAAGEVRPALSPDGRKLAFATPGGESLAVVGLTDTAATATFAAEADAHAAFHAGLIEWSRDGALILSYAGGPIRVFDVSSQKQIAAAVDVPMFGERGPRWRLSDDGRYLVWQRAKGSVLTSEVYDLKERKALGALTAPGCKGSSVKALSHKTGLAATFLWTATDGAKLCVWDIATRKLLSITDLARLPLPAPAHGALPSLLDLAFTADDAAVVVGTMDDALRVRLAKVGGGWLSDLGMAAILGAESDGSVIVMRKDAPPVRIRGQASVEPLAGVGNIDTIEDVASPSHLISGSTYFDLVKQTRTSLQAVTGRYAKATPSPDGRFVAARGHRGIRVWAMPGGTPVFTSPAVLGRVDALALHPDDRSASLVVVAGSDEVVRWDFPAGKRSVLNAPVKDRTELQALAIATSGETLMIRRTWMKPDIESRLYQASRGSEGRIITPGDKSTLQSPRLMSATSARGDVLATSDGHSIRVWDVATAVEKLAFTQPEEVTAIAMSPDGLRMATGSSVGIVRIFDASTGKVLCATPEIERSPGDRAVVFGARGETVIVQSEDVVAWSASTCVQAASWTPARGTGGLSEMDMPMGLVLARGGDRVAVVDARHVRLLDARSLRVVQSIDVAMLDAESVAVGADGQIVLGGSRGVTEVHRATDGKRVLSIVLPEWSTGGVALADDGRYALLGDAHAARAQITCRIGARSVPLAVCVGRLEGAALVDATLTGRSTEDGL